MVLLRQIQQHMLIMSIRINTAAFKSGFTGSVPMAAIFRSIKSPQRFQIIFGQTNIVSLAFDNQPQKAVLFSQPIQG